MGSREEAEGRRQEGEGRRTDKVKGERIKWKVNVRLL
jgi:hypothetical protein